ncbi:MAG: RdgB/HAM1 family non-canonical purine NTP pyrophosphatase [Tissierellia bacterium]|nr:RdgB/HAM1 family non-canonical purine NTP pyrophosphatase [Tissierellia bacterium]
MKKLVIASRNENKILEIKEALSGLSLEIIGQSEVAKDLEVIEDADTLEGNADLKAKALSTISPNTFVLGDDTGLFVKALDGAPGVLSARYAGQAHNDEKNKMKLLKEMEGLSNRQAYFETVFVLYDPFGQKSILTGHCNGTIALEEVGDSGFGYDPIFIPEGYSTSFAEMDIKEKNQISHRGNALKALRQYFETYGVL